MSDKEPDRGGRWFMRTMSRRKFLQAIGASTTGLTVAACVQPGAPPAGEASEQGQADAPVASQSAGELNVVYWADSNDSFKKVIDAFTEETGTKINYEVAPAAYLEWQQFMTTRLASADTTVDVFHCDDFQAAIYGAAGWLVELDPIIDASDIDLSDWPQTLLQDVSSWEGKLYRLPWGNDTEIFFYRTDFFEEAGVEPPKTWNELVEVAAALTQEEEGRYGIALCGAKNGVLGNDIQHWANQAGGAINQSGPSWESRGARPLQGAVCQP